MALIPELSAGLIGGCARFWACTAHSMLGCDRVIPVGEPLLVPMTAGKECRRLCDD